LEGYFDQQFMVNWNDDPKEFWQVFDRTTDQEVLAEDWDYDAAQAVVTVHNAKKYHNYTVNFLAIRLWEEISMYNHITNDWGDKEHLMAVEPRYPETQANILRWLEEWCISHPATTVVRFTSMFYNFAWFWGDDLNNRSLYSDWGSYDFTVNPLALRAFEAERGYKITSEDFVNKGKYNQTHNAPTRRYRDWMDFVNQFVVSFGKECVDLVHKYGKKAYVFYDDSWIGVEPYGKRFAEFGFDGLIKCVFSGFEARLCAGAKGVGTKELRLHPYLFPTGLSGEPTFAPGGDPKLDAQKFWQNVRRALLRKPVDRIGLGGYLHLVEPFPDFCDYMEAVTDEFRLLKSFHQAGSPYEVEGKVVILSAWGDLRSWTCSGHLHEHPEVDLINIIESLSGLPFDVEFKSFDDIKTQGIGADVKVVINAGVLNSAWSGGDAWKDEAVIEALTEYVANGGGLIGVHDPSAADFSSQFFQLSHLFGVDKDLGTQKCLGKYNYTITEKHFITEDSDTLTLPVCEGIFVRDKQVQVLAESQKTPILTTNQFGEGRAVYLSGYRFSLENTRLLMRAILFAAKNERAIEYFVCSNPLTECAYYPGNDKLVIINNTGEPQQTSVRKQTGEEILADLKPYDIQII
jgi:beta-D-galactosyl-(1->4)-L-rhamnose phosphorylase